ncbi:patatin-like phospholipase family protein [Amycolatopsis sp. GM8]|uniref:patatin-like phospholipase family protein n=1 Tax=Amycolatopsis sp. GM8 TaxID=2896530 RepID=UPI001F027D66|nr:patatin-like phospholipase family protein [Amycolatopsis sp. GM8]
MSDKKDKALVLPGGGVLGIAWETGLLAGLESQGVVVTDADYILGTSAGAVVAVQSQTTPMEKLYQDQVDGTGAYEPPITDVDVPHLLKEWKDVVENTADAVECRKIVGSWALEYDRVPEPERRVIIESRLPIHEWPEKLIGVTVIQADTGEFKVWDKFSGVSLVDAVAASCSVPHVWPAVTIDGKRYYDGGLRSNTNVDKAEGYAKVLEIRFMHLPDQPDVRDISGTTDVYKIEPDEASTKARGGNPMNPDLRSALAATGYEQGVRIADEVRAFWS